MFFVSADFDNGFEESQEDGLLDVEVIRRRADVLEIRTSYRLDGKVYDSTHEVQQEIMLDHITRDLVFSMSQKILGIKIEEETLIGHAFFFENWFQHFKATVFPGFLIKIFPIRHRVKQFEQKVVWNICPHYDSAFNKDAKHIEFVTLVMDQS